MGFVLVLMPDFSMEIFKPNIRNEGTEELLKVWFSRQQSIASQGSAGICDLHTIPRYLYSLDFPESQEINQPAQTLEILMSELDPAIMDQFYMKDGITAKDTGFVTDATLFNPRGYSVDEMKSDGTHWTLHSPTETKFSYVSFETRLRQTSYNDLIRKAVKAFKPGKFWTTFFINQSSICSMVLSSPQKIEGFKGLDSQSTMFKDYNFVFTSCAKIQQHQ
ncbi:S-adenosylmethionine decarboxylase proenzyme-like [Psammomys obesus]|uniref:S-adenosylmethionine decarboxylase proenzyme-like n=1 Tax=Psammomys obesus TaxID=48139 RepID=UPI0024530F4B|nr:S-adenosylmethionine decarboxylase proenzyme-like [Psammomys obesus]